MEGPRRGIDAQIESDGAAEHHEEQESLRREMRDAGADQCGHKQAARRAGHRKAKALQDVRGLSDAGLHAGSPQIATGRLGRFPAA